MANPLILPGSRQALMQLMGRELRQANRQKEDERILRAAMTLFSVRESRLAVISSKSSRGGLKTRARAMARSWNSPWEKRPSVQGVSSFSGRFMQLS